MSPNVFLAGIIFTACFCGAVDAQGPPPVDLRRPLPEPIWASSKTQGDPLLFIKESAAAPTARLLFTPSAALHLTNAAGTIVYGAGTDYLWSPGTDVVTLTARSRIAFKTREEMTRTPGAPMSFGKTAAGTGVFFSEGRLFNDLQARATYEHADHWSGTKPAAEAVPLPRTMAKLRSGQPLRMLVLGDSISAGFNASAFVNAPPFQPPYVELVAADLRARFASVVTVINLSVAGKESDWGLTMIPAVVQAKPDLLILAFGMNDQKPSQDFAANMNKMIVQVQGACPPCDVILVASMTGNPLVFPPERFAGYRDAQRRLVKPNVAFADVTTPWMELLRKKNFSDLTGNDVNHPNDFGHMVYAQVISQLLGKEP